VSSRANISVNITGVPIRINGIPFAGLKSNSGSEAMIIIIKVINKPARLFEKLYFLDLIAGRISFRVRKRKKRNTTKVILESVVVG
jgi:hypothetical protein